MMQQMLLSGQWLIDLESKYTSSWISILVNDVRQNLQIRRVYAQFINVCKYHLTMGSGGAKQTVVPVEKSVT